MTLKQALTRLRQPDRAAMEEAQRRLDGIIKPLGSLGLLEQHMVKLAGITGKALPPVERKAVVVFCADNGVVAQGISQSGQEVTRIVAENLAGGDTCVCAMARVAGAVVIPVDIGMAEDTDVPGVLRRKILSGTADFSRQPAMSEAQAVQAVEIGIALAGDLKEQGFHLLATGEMGIGNTTTSAAVAAALLGIPGGLTAGRGAGLSDKMLRHKIEIIDRALTLHGPDPQNPVEVVAAVGGLDIAGIMGLCIGGAVYGVPIVLDGVISCVAALAACRIAPGVADFLLPSHQSAEPIGGRLLSELGMAPLLTAGMRLGEGTGAVATFPLYDMMARIMRDMVTFGDEDMAPYIPLGGTV